MIRRSNIRTAFNSRQSIISDSSHPMLRRAEIDNQCSTSSRNSLSGESQEGGTKSKVSTACLEIY